MAITIHKQEGMYGDSIFHVDHDKHLVSLQTGIGPAGPVLRFSSNNVATISKLPECDVNGVVINATPAPDTSSPPPEFFLPKEPKQPGAAHPLEKKAAEASAPQAAAATVDPPTTTPKDKSNKS